MAKGFDCATPLTPETAAAFVGGGYQFVCRYLVPSGYKRLTKEESEAITAAGLQIISIFETYANRAREGWRSGELDGAAALRTAQEVGQPEGTTIYFAVDYDAPASDYEVIEAYLQSAAAELPGYEVGVYGSYAVIEEMARRGACTKYWQTYAWSKGQKSDAASIYQNQNEVQLNGIDVDLNESYGNEGWWNTMVVNTLSVEDANRMIELLKGMYAAGLSQDEVHRLANALRKASGQPEE